MSDRKAVTARVGRNIKRAMKGRAAIDVSRAVGAHPTQISEWTNGRKLPELPGLLAVAVGLGVSLDTLVRGINAVYDRAAQHARSTDLDEKEAILLATWNAIRENNPVEAEAYLAQFVTRVNTMV
jgi:transcriptional regulator with XRE-family HTH domain